MDSLRAQGTLIVWSLVPAACLKLMAHPHPLQDKFVQINKFVELLVHTGELQRLLESKQGSSVDGALEGSSSSSRGGGFCADDRRSSSSSSSDRLVGSDGGSDAGAGFMNGIISSSSSAVCLLDCGCGSAHLTFGVYHYLRNVMGCDVRLMGVDTNAGLMDRSNRCGSKGKPDRTYLTG